MANLVEVQVLDEGHDHLVVKVHIHGDGGGQVVDHKIIDASVYGASELVLLSVQGSMTGFSCFLNWDASSPVHLWNIAETDVNQDFRRYGGIPNNAGAGKTGDVTITTASLAASAHGQFIASFRKVV